MVIRNTLLHRWCNVTYFLHNNFLFCFAWKALKWASQRRDKPGWWCRENTQGFVSLKTRHVSTALCHMSCQKQILEFAFATLSRALTLYYWLLAAFKFFSITLVHGLTSLLNSTTTCAFQLVQLFWPHKLAGVKEIEPQKGGVGGEVTGKVIGLWRGKRVSVPVHYCCYAVVLPPKVCLLW